MVRCEISNNTILQILGRETAYIEIPENLIKELAKRGIVATISRWMDGSINKVTYKGVAKEILECIALDLAKAGKELVIEEAEIPSIIQKIEEKEKEILKKEIEQLKAELRSTRNQLTEAERELKEKSGYIAFLKSIIAKYCEYQQLPEELEEIEMKREINRIKEEFEEDEEEEYY